MEVDNSTAYKGWKSLKIIGIVATENALNAKARHELMPVENGKTFTVAFWAKVNIEEALSRKVDLSLQMMTDAWPGFYSKTISLDDTDWKEYTDTFIIEVEELTDVWPGLCVAESDVDFWIDDFRFFEGRPEDEVRDSQNPVNPDRRLTISWGRIKTMGL